MCKTKTGQDYKTLYDISVYANTWMREAYLYLVYKGERTPLANLIVKRLKEGIKALDDIGAHP